MIQAGIVGTGTLWEQYRPLLERIRQPIEVTAVYDRVFARAESAAMSAGCDHVTGLTALAGRRDIEAILVFDPGPAGTAVIDLLLAGDKPVFVVPPLVGSSQQFADLYERASHAGITLMPAMPRRYFPASMRLQELNATDLGRPLEVALRMPVRKRCGSGQSESPRQRLKDPQLQMDVVAWLDYCRNLFHSPPEGVAWNQDRLEAWWPAIPAAANGEAPSASGGDVVQSRRVVFEFDNVDAAPDSDTVTVQEPPQIEVRCQRGEARILGRTQLEWTVDSAPPQSETLRSERSENETMLDLFCRRVVGGLIPVADYRDIAQPLSLLQSALNGSV